MSEKQSFLRSIKQRVFPPSSRSFHRRTDNILKQVKATRTGIAQLSSAIADVSNRLNTVEVVQREQADFMRAQMELIQQQGKVLEARSAHNRFFLEALYRQDDEDARQTTIRLFSGLSPAEGSMRISQLTTAKLLHDLDAICKHIGITYWLSSGALVATLYRQGAIPWDDDIDVSMLRADAEKLMAYLVQANAEDADPNEPGYGHQITVIYDCFVKVRQVRFGLVDQDIPCFIDIFFCDLANTAVPGADARVRELYQLQAAELDALTVPGGELEFWARNPYLRAEGSAPCAQVCEIDWDAIDHEEELRCGSLVQSIMTKYHGMLEDEGIILGRDQSTEASPYLVYGIDNLNEVSWRPFVWDASLFFPVRKAAFEGYEVCVPNRAPQICDINYGRQTPYLPNDIFGHSHYAGSTMNDDRTLSAMRRYIES